LLSGGFDNTAILWDVVDRRPIRPLRGHTSVVYPTVFTRDGERAVTGSFDNTLKLWSVKDGKEIATLKGHKDKVFRLAISPADGTIASGSVDGEIRLWDDRTGTFLRTLTTQIGAVGALSFSPDGKRLLSGNGTGTVVRVWDVSTGKEIVSYSKHDNIVIAAALSPDGHFAASAGGSQSQIHIWDLETGETKRTLVGTGTQQFAVAFSTDGRRIAMGATLIMRSYNDRGPLEIQLRLPTGNQGLGRPEKFTQQITPTDWFRGRTKYGTLELVTRKSDASFQNDAFLDIKKDGQTLASIERGMGNGYQHRAYTFSPNGKTIISGGDNGILTAYDLTGKPIGDFVGHEGEVWAVAPSPDGRLLISGGADQTIRLWNLMTHELILTLLVGVDGQWVMSTPQGYYASSPNGERIIGWQINGGPDQTAEYVAASQLRTHFYRPDIVERAVILASAATAVNQMSGKRFLLSDLRKHKPPTFDILSPADKSHASVTPIRLRLQLEANADPIENIEVLVNGRQATTPGIRNAMARLAATPSLERVVEVPLEQGENHIRVIASNNVGQTARELILFRDNPGQLDKKGTLYVLAIGVDKYAQLPPTCGPNGNQSCDLRYAGKDARAFRDVMVKHAGPLFDDTKTLLLTRDGDRPPTKANIEDALEEMFGKAGPTDTTELFIAGHGVTDDHGADYLFLPEGAELVGQAWRRSSVVSWNEFQGALQKTLGRRLMFADTCHSGGAYNNRLVNDAANANIVVFSATDSETLSWEFEDLAHGAFTYALIQGIEGKARRADGSTSVLALGDFVSQEVANLTQNKQQPTFHMSGAKNFALAKEVGEPIVPVPAHPKEAKEPAHKPHPKTNNSWFPNMLWKN
jgi:WD40 repeat protein/uncharacterized caspase-like protein